MKKILLFLTLALLISFSGFSQKYEGIQSLRANAEELNDPGDRAAGWLTWAASSPHWVFHWKVEIQGVFNRFEPADLASHAGEYITRVRYYWPNHPNLPPELTKNPKIRVYTGGTFNGEVYEGNKVVDIEAPMPTGSGNKTVYLPEPILITGTEEICFGVVHFWEAGYIFGRMDEEDPQQVSQYYKPNKSDLVMLSSDDEDDEIFSMTAEGEEGWSITVGAYATPYTWCLPAKDLKVEYVIAGTNCNAVLTWNAPDDNPAAKYNIYRDDVKIASSISAKTYTDKSGTGTNPMDPTKPHSWEVKAICEPAGNETDGIPVNKSACSECDKASNLRVVIEDNCGIAKLEWDASKDATSYKVFKGDTQVEIVEAPKTTLELQGDFKSKINWKVVSVCPIGQSDPITKETNCVGINENKFNFSIKPNPAHNELTISATTTFNSVYIVNFLGQTVISQNNDTPSTTIDVSNLTQGVYFVRIVSDEGTSVQKFVKK